MNTKGILQYIRNAGKAKINNDSQSTEPSFFRFIWNEKRNRRFMWIMLTGTILQFVIFKILYPFADFFSDSYSYIYAASANLDISIWPIGYSKFLRYFHFITHSDTALITFQYFFLELSCLYFFFTILYFYRPVKTNQIILFIFLFFNPLFLYISNYVNSDPLFIALSVLWFTELLWILQRPNLNHILIQGLLLFLCFTIRNNAYIYPFVTIVAFALSRLRSWVKVFGAALGLLLIIPFIIHTRNAAYKMTGTKQFSLFTGWQLANNALYAYEYMDTVKHLSGTGKELDKYSAEFYRITPKSFRGNYLFANPGNFFIQFPGAPLKRYLVTHYKITDDYSSVVAWGKASVVFEEFGKYLIINNKRSYIYEFMGPNTINYFTPHLEKLGVYNLGQNKIDPIAQQWFHYQSNQVHTISLTAQGIILFVFPYLFVIVNAYWLMCIFTLWLTHGFKINSLISKKNIFLNIVFFTLNLVFSVFATIIVMRYQVFPMIICIASGLLMTEWLKQMQAQKKSNTGTSVNNLEKGTWLEPA